MVRINFQPYSREQLERIVEARSASAKEEMDEDENLKPSQVVITPDAIRLAAMTISRITGDARRVLDICRHFSGISDLSFHERLVLASRAKCESVEEIKWSEVQYQYLNFIHSLSFENDPTRKPTSAELLLVFDSLVRRVSSRAIVEEESLWQWQENQMAKLEEDYF